MKTIVQQLKTIVLALVIGLGISYAMAWTGPISAPPADNVPAPINTGSSAQAKQGIFETYGDTYFATTGGSVGIGTTDPRYKLDVRGNIASGLISATDIYSSRDISAARMFCLGRKCIRTWTQVDQGCRLCDSCGGTWPVHAGRRMSWGDWGAWEALGPGCSGGFRPSWAEIRLCCAN